MRLQRWLGLLLALLSACASETARPVQHNGKPAAPVKLAVDQVAKGGGSYEVSVVATPTRDLRSAELRLILPAGVSAEEGDKPASFGPSAAGKPLTLVRHLHLSVDGADVVADVRVDDGITTRNRAHVLRVGAAKPPEAPRPVNTVTLPSGEKVDEVRP